MNHFEGITFKVINDFTATFKIKKNSRVKYRHKIVSGNSVTRSFLRENCIKGKPLDRWLFTKNCNALVFYPYQIKYSPEIFVFKI